MYVVRVHTCHDDVVLLLPLSTVKACFVETFEVSPAPRFFVYHRLP